MGWFPHPALLPLSWAAPSSPSLRTTTPKLSLSHQGHLQRALESDITVLQELQKCCLDVFPATTILGSERIVWKTKESELAFLHLACTAPFGILKAHLFCIRQTGNWYKATLGTNHLLYVHWLGSKVLDSPSTSAAAQLFCFAPLLDFFASLDAIFPASQESHSSKSLSANVWGSVLNQCPNFWGFCYCAIFTALSLLALSTTLGSSTMWTSLTQTQHLAKPG